MLNKFINKYITNMSKEEEVIEVIESDGTKEVIDSNGTISGDYANGITNYRVLAKKHDKTLTQIANYLRKK